MIWTYERGDRVTRVSTRFDADLNQYTLEVLWSDGVQALERFDDVESFTARVLALEQKLVSEEWKQGAGSPQLIQGDWWKP